MRFLYLLSVFGAVALASPILETRQDPRDPCVRIQGTDCPKDHPYLIHKEPLGVCCNKKFD